MHYYFVDYPHMRIESTLTKFPGIPNSGNDDVCCPFNQNRLRSLLFIYM